MHASRNPVAYSVNKGVAIISFQRPDRANSLDLATMKSLRSAFERSERNPFVKARVLTGSDKFFCAGLKLDEVNIADYTPVQEILADITAILLLLERTAKPLVCAVNGMAVGAGAGLALAGDVVLATETAAFSFPFINIGLVQDTGLSRLAGLVGARTAADILFFGEKVFAARALETGMVAAVRPDAELYSNALDAATQLAMLDKKQRTSFRAEVLSKRFRKIHDGTPRELEEPYSRAMQKAREKFDSLADSGPDAQHEVLHAIDRPVTLEFMKKLLELAAQSSLRDLLELERHFQMTAMNGVTPRDAIIAFKEKKGMWPYL